MVINFQLQYPFRLSLSFYLCHSLLYLHNSCMDHLCECHHFIVESLRNRWNEETFGTLVKCFDAQWLEFICHHSTQGSPASAVLYLIFFISLSNFELSSFVIIKRRNSCKYFILSFLFFQFLKRSLKSKFVEVLYTSQAHLLWKDSLSYIIINTKFSVGKGLPKASSGTRCQPLCAYVLY